jgi:hypothetical protein
VNFFSSWKRLGLSTAPKLTIGGQATDRLKCTWRRPAKRLWQLTEEMRESPPL